MNLKSVNLNKEPYFYKSPSESVPTFKFPNRTEPMMIKQDNKDNINKKIPVIFKYSGKLAKEVFLVGTFTGWKEKILMVKRFISYIFVLFKLKQILNYKNIATVILLLLWIYRRVSININLWSMDVGSMIRIK